MQQLTSVHRRPRLAKRGNVQLQFGRTLGKVAIIFGLFMLAVQLWIWSRVYSPPPSAKKYNAPVTANSDPAPTRLPAVIGAIALVGGLVVFAQNLRRPHDVPVTPGPKV